MLRNTNPYHKNVDILTVVLYFLLVLFGWMNLYAANYNPEVGLSFSMNTEYFKQLVWVFVSAGCIGLIMLTDSKLFVEVCYVFFAISIVLIMLTFVIGKEVNGAKAWLAIGPIQIQPVEFTKIGTALVVSRIMSRHDFAFRFRSYVHLFGVLLIPIALVLLQNDTGSALIYFVFLLPMFREGMTPHILLIGAVSVVCAIAALLIESEWVMATVLGIGTAANLLILVRRNARRDGFVSLLACLLGVAVTYAVLYFTGHDVMLEFPLLAGLAAMSVYVVAVAVIKRMHILYKVLMYTWIGVVMAFGTGYIFENILIAHQRTRINILFGIEEDPLGAGYNVNQSLIAIGSGGFTGKGYLEGTQTKLNFVPKQTTDFIFCTVGEEWGFVGAVVLIALYLALFFRLIALAEKQHSVFSRVFGYSVASIFFFHFTVNICMAIGLMPVIGIPLPFFSYGGSSLWGFTMMLFIFLKLDTERNELIR